MFFDILKRDLKRKPLTNIIMLLFVVLSVVFISSSVNNLFALFGSLDRYFEKAEIGDYVVVQYYGGSATVEEAIQNFKDVTFQKEEDIFSTYEFDTSKEETKYEKVIVSCLQNGIYKLFDSNNNEISEVPDGGVYVRQSVLNHSKTKVGDLVTLTAGGVKRTFVVKDTLKDALFGTEFANPRFLISNHDYHEFQQEIERSGKSKSSYLVNLYIINTNDTSSIEKALSVCNRIAINASRESFRMYYLTDMFILGVLLAVSIGLILVAIAILGFAINSTLSREFRQIGIMKAIGITNGTIRTIYITKYFMIATVGAAIGLILSFPFEKILLKHLSKNILLENHNAVLIGILCAAAATLLIMLFSLLCTRKVIHFSPINALRSGTSGERYRRKTIFKLGKTPIRPAFFMAVNDIFINKVHTVTMLIVFFIGIMLMTIIMNTSSTMMSKRMLEWEGEAEFDFEIVEKDLDNTKYYARDGRIKVCETIAKAEEMLAQDGWEATCVIETRVYATVYTEKNPNEVLQVYCREGVNGSPDEYAYIEGTAPQNKNEIAVSYKVADTLKVSIGDIITITTADGQTDDCIITAIFQEILLKPWGSIRRYPDEKYSYEGLYDVLETRIRFQDHPDASEVEKRVELFRKKHPEYEVQTVSEQLSLWLFDAPDKINSFGNLLLLIIALIDILVAVLMEIYFLARERGEIAMLKAIGFKDGTIILWQVLRIGIVMTVATLLAIAFANPIGRLTLDSIYRLVGIKKLIFVPNIWKNYILYPALAFTATIFASFLVALDVRKIHSKEINSVE